jgi:hypothetical protein
MAIKYTNIFHRNTLQNLPKLVFLVRKRTIWQPRSLSVAEVDYPVNRFGKNWKILEQQKKAVLARTKH